MANYNFKRVEPKWQRIWEETEIYKIDLRDAKRPFYNLMEFPYPSGEGLHVGHVYTYSGADTYGRFKRMQGYDVFEPMGFDAFGIHAENYALQLGINPAVLTPKNVQHFREDQMKKLGMMWDWSHEVDTSKPDYYKWTQWLFLQMFKAGLAVRKKAQVNWCPSCKTVLADEQVITGECERCSTKVTKREMEQWFLKITEYADRLLNNLEKLNWPEQTKAMQRNWIGKSEGAEIKFKVVGKDKDLELTVFTTRPDTIFGATYLVLAPEHALVSKIVAPDCKAEVAAYQREVQGKKELERMTTEKEKTGVFTGAYAINPANQKSIPIWIADYVLMHYGSGAIMAVPAHDARDFEFSMKYRLPVREVIQPKQSFRGEVFTGEGILINSGQFNGLDSAKARKEIIAWLSSKGLAKEKITYRLHDWCISRQRYWGPPIPIIYCRECGTVPVPEEQLPVELPFVEDFRPKGTGKSPLAEIKDFVHTKCPQCGGEAQRETDVSDNFLDSAWYFLRYPSTEYDDRPFDRELTEKWLPVACYTGGPEHACLHHLYARFVTMALHDLGFLSFEEPFAELRLHGIITKDGAKISKSRGNVINPDQYVEEYGADAFRMYMLFLGPFDQGGDFKDFGIAGITRFLNKAWVLITSERRNSSKEDIDLGFMHRIIKKVGEDLEEQRFNTAIAALMEYVNWLQEKRDHFTDQEWQEAIRNLILMLAPFAPHFSEEAWEKIGGRYSVHNQSWPKYDPKMAEGKRVTIAVQVNGKLRDRLEDIPAGADKSQIEALALASEKVKSFISGKEIRRIIYVPDRLINIVI